MTTTFGNSSPDLVEIMHDIRTQLSHKGCHAFRLLTQAFAVNDRQSNNQFGFDAFVAVLGKVGVFLSLQNAKKMFRYFEQLNNPSGNHPTNPSNQTSTINFIEFLQTLQGMMSQRRFDLICQVFDTIDQSVNQSRTGSIDFQSVLDRFDARVHPEVLSGKKTVDQVRSEFVAAFDGSHNRRLSRDSFIDFYAGISACTPLDDDFFCTTLERCFAINQTTNQSVKRGALLKSVRAMLRTRISTRDQAGPRTESEKLRALLKWYDLSNSGMVDFNQFHGALQRFGLVLDDKTVHSLFEAFDYEHTGKINYAEFVAVLYEEDLVSTYWSERQQKHNLDRSNNQTSNEEKTQERQYLSNDSVILSTPKFPAAGTINAALKHSNAESSRQQQTSNHPVNRATAVFVLGGPGSGKGTQCARIVEEFGYTHLSTGDLLRIEQSNPKSEFGALINACITEGKLVPMKLIVQLLEQAILNGMKEGRSNYLVDGFPRAVDQIGCWNEIMGRHAVKVPFVLYFDVPLPVLEQRLIARGQTSGRADDNIESIKKRFVTFETESRPVVSHFAQEGRVRVLDGTKKPEEVYSEVRACIQSLAK